MYTILINSDNTLTQSIRERIMHRESNIHTFRFLVDPIWVDKGVSTDMRNYTCVLEYRTPISNTYVPIPLSPSKELYKEKLEYIFPIDTNLTAEVGNLEIKFIFTWLEMDADGKFIEHSRKTDTTVIPIIKTDQWSDYIVDSNLDNLAQIMLSTQAQTEQISAYANLIYATKADGVKYDRDLNKLTLTAHGSPIDEVILEDCDCEDGIPAVDFTTGSNTPIEPEIPSEEDSETNNVVEF